MFCSLENIEDGNIGCFKDIFILKEYIYNYAKYLGLEPEKIIDEFNEYLFEYTSKIPLEDIEKAMKELQKEETEEVKIVSPYTTPVKTNSNKWMTVLFVVLAVLVLIVVIWAVKQITVDSTTTNMVSYISK